MKAVLCHQFGAPKDIETADVDDPVAAPGHVIVRVKAAGLNFPDALLVAGKYQATPPLPFVPGSEFSGIVETIGEGISTFKPGDRVFGMCNEFGAYAERVSVPVDTVFHMPAGMPFPIGANILCAHGTAHHALRQRAELQAGETVLVLGAGGGTGIAAVQIAKAIGAKVIAAASSDEKLQLAKRHGADELINYTRSDLRQSVKDLTGGGVDVVFDPVGGDLFDTCTRLMNRKGRLLIVGFASGRIPKMGANLPLVKEFSVVGVFWGSFTRHEPAEFQKNLAEMTQWYQDGQIAVEIEKEVPLAQTGAALQALLDRKVLGKQVVVVNGESGV